MMKKTHLICLLLLVFSLTSCAHYRATTLAPLPLEEQPQIAGVTVFAKAFTPADCTHYLDRNVIRKGYQPVQVYIENATDRTYLFSLNRVSLAHADAEEVANKVHTFTLGRVAAYSIAAVFATPFFAIPALLDGVQSLRANIALDNDFSEKAARDQLIYPYSHLNTLLFVPKESFQNSFSITLIDQETQEPMKLIASS